MTEDFKFFAPSTISAPGRSGVIVTPSDTTVIPTTRALFVSGTSDVAVLFADNTVSVILEAVPAGSFPPVRVRTVLSTGTTATAIVALH